MLLNLMMMKRMGLNTTTLLIKSAISSARLLKRRMNWNLSMKKITDTAVKHFDFTGGKKYRQYDKKVNL